MWQKYPKNNTNKYYLAQCLESNIAMKRNDLCCGRLYWHKNEIFILNIFLCLFLATTPMFYHHIKYSFIYLEDVSYANFIVMSN